MLSSKKGWQLPVLILSFIALAWFGLNFFRTQSKHWQVKAQTTALTLTELAQENEELKAKVDASSKIKTDNNTKELMRYYIRKYFPESEWSLAEKIMTCESNMNPQTINERNKDGSTDRGAWQLNSVHAQRFQKMYGIKWEIGAHDPDLSTQYAKYLYDNQGWGPWVCRRYV